MIKHGAILGIGTVILVIGLTGLGLLQTGVINPTEVKLPEPPPASSQQCPGAADQIAPATVPAPPSGAGAGTQSGAALTERPAQGQQPRSGNLAAEKPVPVPHVGSGERRYPKPDQVAKRRPSSVKLNRELSQGAKTYRKSGKDEKRKPAHRKSGPGRYAHKTSPARSHQPVVIKFTFDPTQDHGLNVAQVHSGDKIKVKLRRVGPVDRRVYFTFSRDINSPQGGVLELKTAGSAEGPAIYRTADAGYYVVEVKIYPGNRWNIKPRRFV